MIKRTIFNEQHDAFRATFQTFVRDAIVPNNPAWERAGVVDRAMFAAAGKAGFLARALPAKYGGRAETDFRFSQIMSEESELAGVAAAGSGIGLHNDMVVPYFARYSSEDQKERWFHGLCSGALIGAIAITEPGAGSDVAGIATTAAQAGGGYVLNGSKTLIGNGMNADLVIVAARAPDTERHSGISLFVVERGMPGLDRSTLKKVGRKAQDTSRLEFEDVIVPVDNVLGEPGRGFEHLMANLPQERLNIAVAAVAGSRYAFELTLDYVGNRKAFGKPIASFQHSRFVMADMATEIQIAQVFVDRCVESFNEGALTGVEAAMAKLWCTELQKRVNDRCLQLHGGHGYTEELPISWAWRDGRVTTIYGGTSEIMKEIIGRSLDL